MGTMHTPNFIQFMRWSAIILLCAYGLKQALCASAAPQPAPEQNQVFLPQITQSVQQPDRNAPESFHVLNATPNLINVQFTTVQGVTITQPVNPNSEYLLQRKPASVTLYSRQQGQPLPITPDMIINGTVTIKMEAPVSQAANIETAPITPGQPTTVPLPGQPSAAPAQPALRSLGEVGTQQQQQVKQAPVTSAIPQQVRAQPG